MSFLTPQGDNVDCCCGGESPCSCNAGIDICSNIAWQCLQVHRIRIHQLTGDGGTVVLTVFESDKRIGEYRPTASGWYRIEKCCQAPGYGLECLWEQVGQDVYVDIAAPSCTVYLGMSLRDTLNPTCTPVEFFVNAFTSEINGPLIELSINGQNFLPAPSNIAGCLPATSDLVCGDLIGTCPDPMSENPFVLNRPTALSTVKARAKNAIGHVRVCEYIIPCLWKTNAIAIGVPSFFGHSATCSGTAVAGLGIGRHRTSWFYEFELDISWEGTYFLEFCDGNVQLATGTYRVQSNESGVERFVDDNSNVVTHPYYSNITMTGSIQALMVLTYDFGGMINGAQLGISARTNGAFPSWGDFNLHTEALIPVSWSDPGAPTISDQPWRCPFGGGWAAPGLTDLAIFMRTIDPSTTIRCANPTDGWADSSSGTWTWERRRGVGYDLECTGHGVPPNYWLWYNPCNDLPTWIWDSAGTFPAALTTVS